MSVLKTITEGNQTYCQDLVKANNPILITNTEALKNKNSIELLNNLNVINKVWNGYNILNSSLYETGVHHIGSFSSFSSFKLFLFLSLVLLCMV